MRIQTTEKKVYNYEDIINNKELKKKVIEEQRYINIDDFWHVDEVDYIESQLEQLGYIGADYKFTGFYSQGDGGSFTCDEIDIEKVLNRVNIEIRFNLQEILKDDTSFYIKRIGRYYHEGSMDIIINEGYLKGCENINNYIAEIQNELYNHIKNEVEKLAKKFYNQLMEYYETLTSENEILKTIKDLELEFDENGELI